MHSMAALLAWQLYYLPGFYRGKFREASRYKWQKMVKRYGFRPKNDDNDLAAGEVLLVLKTTVNGQ